jgi:hypothetical protein
LAQQQLVAAGARLQGEPQHRSLLGLGVNHHVGHAGDDDVEARGDVGGCRGRQERRGDDLGVGGGQQGGLAREVAVGGGPGDAGMLGCALDRRNDALGDE